MFGIRLRCLRKRAGLKQVELASRVCIRPHTLWRYEAGRSMPKAAVLLRLAKALSEASGDHVTVDTLLGDEPLAWRAHG